MNILFVAPRIPFPLDTGGKIRTFNLLKQVAGVHRVTLLSFSFGDEPRDYQRVFRDFGVPVVTVPGRDSLSLDACASSLIKNLPLSVAKYRSPAMARVLIREVRQGHIDLVHFDHVHMGQYIGMVPGVPAVVDEHNVECFILKRLAQNEKNPLKKLLIGREYRKMRGLEKKVCGQAFRTLVVSQEDGRNLGEVCGAEVKYEVIPNGVDTEYFRTSDLGHRTSSENALVFTGSMDWVPNSDAVLYFCREVLPLIWEKAPDVKFYVVGKNPPESVRALENKELRIIVTGAVPDVRPYVERSKVFVVPLRIGGGTRLKILEAMAMQKAVVSTTIGAEGIACSDGKDICIADAPQDIADSIIQLLPDEMTRKNMGKAGRELVERVYAWNVIGKKLAGVYEQVASLD